MSKTTTDKNLQKNSEKSYCNITHTTAQEVACWLLNMGSFNASSLHVDLW